MEGKFIKSVTPKNSSEPRNDKMYVGQWMRNVFKLTGEETTVNSFTKAREVQVHEIQLKYERLPEFENSEAPYYVGVTEKGNELFRFWKSSVNIEYGYIVDRDE